MSTRFPEYTVQQPNLELTETRYTEFHERLAAAQNADDCLALISDWDGVLCEFKEWSNLTEIRFHQDTTNEAYKAAKERLDEASPKFTDLETQLKQAFLDCPLRSQIEVSTGSQLFDKWQCNTKSFSSAIEKDLITESTLQSQFTSLTAGGKILFQDSEFTLPEMNQFFDHADRDIRKASYFAHSNWYADNAPELDRIYDEQVKVRHSMAKKLGYKTFTELGYQRMTRIGYGPEEVATFRDEVRDKVVPLACEVAAQQSQ
ncbi:M3 family metallopeptidase, partial [Verrucomicrobiales bacterium]|nr:M3 family metallopeptidase [Verrucomicrobiales bacterium]